MTCSVSGSYLCAQTQSQMVGCVGLQQFESRLWRPARLVHFLVAHAPQHNIMDSWMETEGLVWGIHRAQWCTQSLEAVSVMPGWLTCHCMRAGGTAVCSGTAQRAGIGSMTALGWTTARQQQGNAAIRDIMTRDDGAICHTSYVS